MRKISLALLLCVVLAVLAGCASPQYFPTVTQAPPANNNTVNATAVPTDVPQESFDPAAEEQQGDNTADAAQDQTSTEAYGFAGATPLPLDPIDIPSPPPRDKLTFTYQTYDVTKLGVKFDGPAGWTVDDLADDTFTITEPEKRDNYAAFISIRKTSVNKQYTVSDMEKEVKDVMDTIGSTNYTVWQPTYTAERTLMDQAGAYADYSGTMVDGTRVRGRVHVTCIDKVLYIIHMSHAAAYNSDYLKNHAKLRATMALTK